MGEMDGPINYMKDSNNSDILPNTLVRVGVNTYAFVNEYVPRGPNSIAKMDFPNGRNVYVGGENVNKSDAAYDASKLTVLTEKERGALASKIEWLVSALDGREEDGL